RSHHRPQHPNGRAAAEPEASPEFATRRLLTSALSLDDARLLLVGLRRSFTARPKAIRTARPACRYCHRCDPAGARPACPAAAGVDSPAGCEPDTGGDALP